MRSELNIDPSLLRPGMRLAVGVSGGADSVALLRTLAGRKDELGLVLSVAHLHHGLRGDEADADLEFVRALAGGLGLAFHERRIDTASEASRLPGKPAETIEEAARRLRYAWFRELMGGDPSGAKAPAFSVGPNVRAEARTLDGVVDAVATAHTLDDQAETVLAKLLRGAWTEGLSGIFPVVQLPEGQVIRPLLHVRRGEVEDYLRALGQDWREDSSNRALAFTRNRIRHELLPLLEGWNPRLREHLAQMAELARDEETWWGAEVGRVASQIILAGRPVRGGGRAASEGISIDLRRFAELAPALQRRLLRHAADQLGCGVDFQATESLRTLALTGRAGQRSELAGGLRAERTHRELRMAIQPKKAAGSAAGTSPDEVEVPIPGECLVEAFSVHIRIDAYGSGTPSRAVLRNWKPGDRVRLRHSSGLRKVKEVLERMKVSGAERACWPVLECGGRIVWMPGAALEPEPGLSITAEEIVTRDGKDRDQGLGARHQGPGARDQENRD